MQYHSVGSAHMVDGVDCQRQFWCWRLLRSLMQLIIPCCSHGYPQQQQLREETKDAEDDDNVKRRRRFVKRYSVPRAALVPSTSIITATFFGYRHGKLSFCIQPNSKTASPLLLLTLSVPTALLAKEMRSDLLRIALECRLDQRKGTGGEQLPRLSLLSMPLWTVFCNGRKAGFAVRRQPSQADMDVLRAMQSIRVGAGIMRSSTEAVSCSSNELMYLRANFRRVSGLRSDSESFHLINPEGNAGQQLSIFFFRSR
ncbi:hypothetical protein ACLOJK_013508 [Asimina triloba]